MFTINLFYTHFVLSFDMRAVCSYNSERLGEYLALILQTRKKYSLIFSVMLMITNF
jgi:hypothetical protein